MRKNGNVVLIAPREELALKEKQQLESAMRRSASSSRCISESFQLNYIKASDLAEADHDQSRRSGWCRWRGSAGRAGLDPVAPRRRRRRSALEHPVRAGHGVAAGGSPAHHSPDRHADPPGADRGADRDRQRQLRPAARRALRPADRFHVQQQELLGSARAASLATQPVVRAARRSPDPRDENADAVRARVGHRDRRLLGFAAAQRQPAGAERRRAARADAHQPRQRQPHQPRALGARGGRPRQGGVEPARDHRRQPEGGHRAGDGNSVRDARHREHAGDRAVQEGRAATRRHAADHRRQTASS